MSKGILVTGSSVSDDYLGKLRAAGFAVDNPTQFLNDRDLASALKDKVAYLCGGDEKATEAVLLASPKLRHYAFLGVGYESFIDSNAATRAGVAITNTPGTLTASVAEMTIGMLLGVSRQITFLNNRAKQGHSEAEKMRDLAGQTLGIIGMGNIGTEIAKRLHGCFDMKVLYHNRAPKKSLPAGLTAVYKPLDSLLRESDVVLLMAPGNDQTNGMIAGPQIALMKRGAILINTSRASLVVPEALLQALKNGHIRAAAFDGYFQEPLPKPDADPYGFLQLPDDQFVVTPHIASLTHDARDRMSELCVRSIINFAQRGDDPCIVNPEYKRNARK